MSSTKNRRQAFRLNDDMKLHARILDPQELDSIVSDFDAFRMRHCLVSHLRNETENLLPKLVLIRKRDPDVAQYLDHLDRQIALLADRLSSSSDLKFIGSHPEIPVNLSAAGIRFSMPGKPELGQTLELGLLLSTSGTQVMALAEVVRVEAVTTESGERWQVSTRYTHIHPDDTELVIRHMANLQRIELQARKAG